MVTGYIASDIVACVETIPEVLPIAFSGDLQLRCLGVAHEGGRGGGAINVAMREVLHEIVGSETVIHESILDLRGIRPALLGPFALFLITSLPIPLVPTFSILRLAARFTFLNFRAVLVDAPIADDAAKVFLAPHGVLVFDLRSGHVGLPFALFIPQEGVVGNHVDSADFCRTIPTTTTVSISPQELYYDVQLGVDRVNNSTLGREFSQALTFLVAVFC